MDISSLSLTKICPVKLEQRELDVVHHEIDSLDNSQLIQLCANAIKFSNANDDHDSSITGASYTSRQNEISKYCLYMPYPALSAQDETFVPENNAPLSSKNRVFISPEIAEDARLETTVLDQVAELKQKGMWSSSRLPKVMEPTADISTHDFLISEAMWLAVDFAEERKWKMLVAKMLAEAAQNYLILRQQWNNQCDLNDERCRKRNATAVSHMIAEWWDSIRQEVETLADRASRTHLNRSIQKNKLLLAINSELVPEWLAGAFSEASPASSSVDRQSMQAQIDDDLDDYDWAPSVSCSTSPSSSIRSTSSDSNHELISPVLRRSYGIQEIPLAELSSSQCDHVTAPSTAITHETETAHGTLSEEPRHQTDPPLLVDDDEENIDPMEVQELLSEADLSMDRLLHPAYCKAEDSVSLSEVNKTSPSHDSFNHDELPHSASAHLTTEHQDDSLDESMDAEENYSCSSSSSLRSAGDLPSWIRPPWTHHAMLIHRNPTELRRSCLVISPLLRVISSSSRTLYADALTTAFGPTFRVRSLPTISIGGVVSWLRQAFFHSVPGLLLSPNPISGDAEFAIAAHLGQLVTPGHSNFSSAQRSDIGSWGPHLIVAPRLHLAAWKSRLSNWCPGLRIACLGLGSQGPSVPYAPPGSGRRLAKAISRGAINVCITTYAAIRSRPSRYNRIVWNVVILDQVHNVLPCSDEAVIKGATSDDDATNQNFTNRMSSEMIDLLVSEIQCSGHRLLISSVPDLLLSSCGFRLFELARLLLSNHSVSSINAHQLWMADLFDGIHQLSNSHVASRTDRGRPSKKQMLKFLEPFILRLDEEYERDSGINDQLLRCPMTPIQRDLYGAVMTSKTARNASKTGDLSDLLKTIASASGICTHPAFAECAMKTTPAFRKLLHNLHSRSVPAHGPFIFDNLIEQHDVGRSCLLYSTPELVLNAVKLAREAELRDLSSHLFNITRISEEPTHVRDRIVSLLPSKNHFRSVLETATSRRAPVHTNGDVHFGNEREASARDSFKADEIKFTTKLTNGVAESIAPHLNFADIPVRNKRPRTASLMTPGAGGALPSKRQRTEDPSTAQLSMLGRQTLKQLEPDNKICPRAPSPFLGPDVLKKLEIEFSDKISRSSGPNKTKSNLPDVARGPTDPRTNSKLPSSRDSPPSPQDLVKTCISSSLHLESLFRANTIRCTNSSLCADWCSQSVCSSLLIDSPSLEQLAFLHTPEPLKHGYSWLSSSICSSLLCTRPRTIATPVRILSLRHPSGQNTQVSVRQDNVLAFESQHTRWLNPDSVRSACLNFGCPSFVPSSFQSPCTPLGRLFNESGKFWALHQLLGQLLGSNVRKRPRCVYFLAHRSGVLDLLEAYLNISPWRSFTRLRTPSNYDAVSATALSMVNRINYWPRGSKGPLFVLVHARSPVSCWMGLRAGPDCVVIILDVDWRVEAVDNLRSLLHSWVLNGLVDSEPQSSALTQIYRLVTFGPSPIVENLSTVEARLDRGVARRLLPQSVFQAHSTLTRNRRLPIVARVQPNVVNELLPPIESLTKVYEREFSWGIKQEAPSCSSPSSVTSSFSYPMGDAHRDDSTRDASEDDYMWFREREPMSGQALHRWFELFEDAVDAQAWCCASAEQTAVARSIFQDAPEEQACTSDSDGDWCEHDISCAEMFLVDPSLESTHYTRGLLDEFGYTDLTGWEVAHNEACRFLTAINDLKDQPNNEILSYAPFVLEVEDSQVLLETFSDSDSQKCFAQLPVWNPFKSHLPATKDDTSQAALNSTASRAVFSLGEDDAVLTETVASQPASCISTESPPYRFDDSDWGYESDPMSECDLPPITLPVVSDAFATARPTDHINQRAGHRGHLSSATTSPYLKRRRVGLGAVKSSAVSQSRLSPSASTSTTEESELQKDSTNEPAASAQATSGSTASSVTTTQPSGTCGGILLTLSHHIGSTPFKLNIPRVCYNKEMTSSRTNRLRRLAPGSSAIHMDLQKQPASGNISSFSNMPSLGRYGQASPGRPGQPPRGTSKEPGGMYGPAGSSVLGGTGVSGHLHIGKPLDWLPYEEAALYQSVTKLQELPFEPSSTLQQSCSPNFRLAEFFINNYFPTRCYRGSRQCLFMHSRMHSICSTASSILAAGGLSSSTKNLDDSFTALAPTNTPSSSGRKVKNKMKSSVATAASNLAHSQGPNFPTGGTNDLGADNVAAVNRFRVYLVYQFLQASSVGNTAQSTTDSTSPPLPPYLTQLFNVLKTTDDTQAKFLRKAIRDGLFPPVGISLSQYHRPLGVRRQSSTTSSGTGGGGTTASGTGGSSGLFAYSGSSSTFTPSTSHSTTTPALLTHQRQRHAAHDSLSSGGFSSPPTTQELTGSSASVSGGSMIQKNPSHIAALQEHNINPDALITPAMVLKNKEEREARRLAESAVSTSQSTAPASSGITSLQSGTPVQSGSSGSYSAQVGHPDSTHHQPVFLSIAAEVPASGSVVTAATSTAAMSFTGGHLSFTPSGQRGSNFVTIVSSHPTVIRRSATFTSGSQSIGQMMESPLSGRITSLQSGQPQNQLFTIGTPTGSTKGTLQTGYFVQQRPSFISTSQSLTGARGGNTNFIPSVAPIPQILRPHGTLRGSVVQPAFVRTITPSKNSAAYPGGQVTTRFTASSALAHGRMTLANNSTISTVNASRISSVTAVRHSTPAIFQHIRPVSPVIGSGGVSFNLTDHRMPSTPHHTIALSTSHPMESFPTETSATNRPEIDRSQPSS